MMGEQKVAKTIDQIWQDSDDADTAAQIAEQLHRSATSGIHIPEIAAVATALHDELAKRLELASSPEEALQIARAARSHFRQRQKELTDVYIKHQIEHVWERRHALRHYGLFLKERPADSKYSLAEIAQYKDQNEKAQSVKGTTPTVDDSSEEI
jgi:hypothetical protein